MSGYIGTQPVPQATQTRDVFTATSGQTSFATSGYTPNFLDVWLNGVKLVNGDDFTATNGSDVVLTSGAAAGDTVEVLAYSTFQTGDFVPTSGGTFTGGLNTHSANPVIDYNSGSTQTFGNAFKAPSGSSRAAAFIAASSGEASCWWVNNANEARGAVDSISTGGLALWSNDGTAWDRGLQILPDNLVAFDGDITTGGVFRGKTPFMQVEHNSGALTYPDGTSNVFYNQIIYAQGGVSHNSNYNFTFTHAGFYRLTTTYRYGSGGDVWTSMQLVDGGTVLGRSHGTGQIHGGDPATNVFDFVAAIGAGNVNRNLQLQFIRSGSGFTIGDTGHGAELITIVQWMGA